MLGLFNPYFIGDSVMLEVIARKLSEKTEVAIISSYPELFIAHPVVKAYTLDDMPDDINLIDMANAIRGIKQVDGKNVYVENKIELMCQVAQISIADIKQPELYLTPEEKEESKRLKGLNGGCNVGVVLESRHPEKDWAYMAQLVKSLTYKYHVHVIGQGIKDRYPYLKDLNITYIDNVSLRQLMVHISALDMVVGVDTGPMHIAGALRIPTVVIGFEQYGYLYNLYKNCRYLNARDLKTINIRKVYKACKGILKTIKERNADEFILDTAGRHPILINKPIRSSAGDIALFRLDGLGGSITLTDQATKIFNMTGIKSTLVVRNNKDIFLGHPHIKQVIEVGYVNWGESLREILKEFDTVAEIRFGLGKWHQSGKKIFDQDFSQLQGLFDQFPRNYNQFEIHNLHHIQLTDKTLGLPFEDIQSRLYHFEDIKDFNLPDEYILMNNGVDAQHQGMKQTKTWDYWNDLVQLIDLPIVQIGTQYDRLINSKTIDLRNKANMGELAQIVKSAKGVVCTEGGIMHLAYAVDCPNVFVIRGPTRGKLFEYPGHHFIDSYICDNCWSTTDDWYINCPKECGAVCMESITPERVAYNLERVLNENMVTDIRI